MKKTGEIAVIDAQNEANSHVGAMQSRYDTFKEEAQYLVAAHQIRLIKLEDEIFICDKLIEKLSDENFSFDIVEMGAVFVVRFEEEKNNKTKAYFLVPGGTGMFVCLDGLDAICVSPSAPLVNDFQGLSVGDEFDKISKNNVLISNLIIDIN